VAGAPNRAENASQTPAAQGPAGDALTESGGVVLAVVREVFAELKNRRLEPTPRNFQLVCDVVCGRLGVFATLGGTASAELRNWRVVRTELTDIARLCIDFLGRFAAGRADVGAAFERLRQDVGASEPLRLRLVRDELLSRLHALAGEWTSPDDRTVVQEVLRTVADYMAMATAGSAAFGTRVEEIRHRVESASGMDDLRALQGLLGEAVANAAREASSMRAELERLNRQISWSSRQINTLEQALVESRRAMHVDPLTRVPNRRALDEWVAANLYDAQRLARPYSLLVLDLDRFKQINDEHGHLIGDRVLVEAARRLLAGIRDKDFLARYGGEEFVIVLPDCALPIAEAVARRLCAILERKPVVHQEVQVPVTTSVGVAEAHAEEGFAEIFARADRCVYLAKETGRNRAVSERELQGAPRHPPGATAEAS
jgi:diguanylate cyclase